MTGVAALFLAGACGLMEIEKAGEGNSGRGYILSDVRFGDLEPATGGVSPVNFSATITSTMPIKSVYLLVEDEGVFTREAVMSSDVLQGEMLSNQDFESFSLDIATYWSIWESLSTNASFSSDTGYQGFSQRINVEDKGSWGIFIFQEADLSAGKEYQWSFWYRTDGGTSLSAQVAGDGLSEVFHEMEIPGTFGQWNCKTLIFTAEESREVKLRILSEHSGTFWIDEASLREVDEKSDLLEVTPNFELSLAPGTYRWYLEAVDMKGAGRSKMMTLTVNP